MQLKQPSSSLVKEYTFDCKWEPAAFLMSEDFASPEKQTTFTIESKYISNDNLLCILQDLSNYY
jgi:hypothetical protein